MRRSGSAIGRSALLVSTGILLSRVLGLVRDVVFAHTWGTGLAMAAFVAAFTVPNLLRALFGEGAFSAAFVPVLSRHLEERGKEAAWGTACRVISVLAATLAVIVLVAVCLLHPLRAFLPGALPQLTLRLLPWLLPYAVLVCVSGAFAGVLHTLGRFGVPAFSPVLLNAALIGASFVVCPLFGDTPEERVFGLVAAVLAAGTAQVVLHVAACRLDGLRFRLEPDVRSSDVHEVAKLMAPALVGTGVLQLNVAVDRCLAVYLGSGATTSLYYSQRLVYLPVGLFGVALGVVCLPAMARAWSRGDREDMLASFRYSLRLVFFLTLPTTVLLALLGGGIIELLFQHGAFTAQSRAETLYAMAFYLPGIPAFACTKIAVTAFHARRDTATPVRIACLCLVLNVVLNVVLMQFLRQGGLALATTICSYVNVSLLFITLRKELGPLGLAAMWPDLLRTCVASGAAAAGTALGVAGMARWGGGAELPTLFLLVSRVAVPAAAGGLSFVGSAVLLRCTEVREIAADLAGRLRRA